MAVFYKGRVLIVDDDHESTRYWKLALCEQGFRVETARNLEEMHDVMERYFVDAVLLDLELEYASGLDGLPYLAKESPFSKIFILTAKASVQSAVTAMNKGAHGYLTKSTPPEEVAKKIDDSLNPSGHLSTHPRIGLMEVGLIGKSKAYHQLCTRISQLKDVDSTVLVHGESGTGKEIVSRALHKLSPRHDKRFEAINCAAIPENLLESELFGHKKGSFTDAKSDRKGIFELCSDGTLLLDEIGDMPLNLQSKLLRVLEEKVVVPVGGSNPVKINTRVIAATNRDLLEEIQNGRFREDLYYRLTVVPIHVPPLRHRKDDIPVLLEYFLQLFNDRFGKSVKYPPVNILQRILAHDWPGNIRELRNSIERAVVLSPSYDLRIEDMLTHLHNSPSNELGEYPNTRPQKPNQDSASIPDDVFDLPLSDAKQMFEKAYITRLLKRTGGNITATSKKAKRYRADIYRILEKYDLNHQSYKF